MIQNRTKGCMKKRDKGNSHMSRKPHMIYVSSNNDRHAGTKPCTLLHYTCWYFIFFFI